MKWLESDVVKPVGVVLDHYFKFHHKYSDQSHLPLSMAEPFAKISNVAGTPADQVRMVVCLLAALPLGLVHRKLPGKNIKHVFSALVGLFYVWFVTGVSGKTSPPSLSLSRSYLFVPQALSILYCHP